jgi:hypothetical protein
VFARGINSTGIVLCSCYKGCLSLGAFDYIREFNSRHFTSNLRHAVTDRDWGAHNKAGYCSGRNNVS